MCLDQGKTRAGDGVSGDLVTRTDVAPTLLWMECGACSGESMAILGVEGTLPDHPEGDLLQAGSLLVEDGRIVFELGADAEGFSAASEQFDSDITAGRHPRAAIGLGDGHMTVVSCDGRRSLVDGGLTMLELAETMHRLNCEVAMNLDGGGSTTMVHRGHLLNRPYSEQDQPAPASRPIVTALVLRGRG